MGRPRLWGGLDCGPGQLRGLVSGLALLEGDLVSLKVFLEDRPA
jgi:hypothetical protein